MPTGTAALGNVLSVGNNKDRSDFNIVFDDQRFIRPAGKIALGSMHATEQCSCLSQQSPSLLSLGGPANLGQIQEPLTDCSLMRAVLHQKKRVILPDTILALPESQDPRTADAIALQTKRDS